MVNNLEKHQITTPKASDVSSTCKINTMTGSLATAAMVLLTACTISSYRSTSGGHNVLRVNDDISGCSNDDNVRRGFQKDCDPKTLREFYNGALKCFSCKKRKQMISMEPHISIGPAPRIRRAPDIGSAKPPDEKRGRPPKAPKTDSAYNRFIQNILDRLR